MTVTLSQIVASAATSAPESGFEGIAPGGPLIAIGAAIALLILGLVAAVASLRGPNHGTEGTRRTRRGFGPDALDAAARELRPSRTGGPVPPSTDPARLPRQIPVHPQTPAIPEEVRAWQSRRESR